MAQPGPSVASSSNFHPGVTPVAPSDPLQASGAGDYYGANPLFRRIFRGKKSGGIIAAPVANAYVPPAPANPPGGTLVFPNHQFMRSPRDFFMIEVN